MSYSHLSLGNGRQVLVQARRYRGGVRAVFIFQGMELLDAAWDTGKGWEGSTTFAQEQVVPVAEQLYARARR